MKNKFMKKYFIIIFALLFLACKNDAMPKPKGQLSLEYPKPVYENLVSNAYFDFQKNQLAQIKSTGNGSIEINYPKMKATLYLNYKSVTNNLDSLLIDAQRLTYDHAIKANDINEQPFINPKSKVYGMFYQVGGNAATNVQFYATDSVKNFLVGSLYFYAKPNFDSILPAADYLKTDMKQIMETIRWK